MAEHDDVINIGTGADLGTLVHPRAPSGTRILFFERGGFIPREKDNRDPMQCRQRSLRLAGPAHLHPRRRSLCGPERADADARAGPGDQAPMQRKERP
jgi:hypothetical protein